MDEVTRKWVRSAADERAAAEGCWFDEAAGQYVVDFFSEFLRHTLGEWAGRPFDLQPWQRDDVIMPLFGWRRGDGLRRYRRAYIEVPKKNGKSSLCAGLALYMLVGDGEPRAQIYGAAADREQAGIVFQEAASMVAAAAELAARLETVRSTKRIVDHRTGSFYHAISADSYTNEGLNAHAIIFDELHAQRTRDLWDTLRYATASRRQPLTVSITTAGYDRETICWEQHEYARGVAEGTIQDAAFFGYIRGAAEDADWTRPETWATANPSLGVTIRQDDMAEACAEARQSARKENAFRRYRLNQWVGHTEAWLSSESWSRGAEPFDEAMLEGRRCYGGIDLARKRDLAAVVWVFPIGDSYYLAPRFFLPRERVEEKERIDHVSYRSWARAGLVTLTDGDVIDYRVVRSRVLEDARRYRVAEIGYDPWNAELLCNQMLGDEDGLATIEVRQTFGSLGPATAEFERLLASGRLRHGGHPVLGWMAGHCVVREDANLNIMPSKRQSRSRIDGIVASIIGLGRALADAKPSSVYSSRGLIVL